MPVRRPADIKDEPTRSSNLNTDPITGMATSDDRMPIMLDMARFLTDEVLVARESAWTADCGSAVLGSALGLAGILADRQPVGLF
jgi:hypothetical protein